MPEHKKPLPNDRNFLRPETLFPFGASIRRNTWPRAKVYPSTDASLFSQATMKARPRGRSIKRGRVGYHIPALFLRQAARLNDLRLVTRLRFFPVQHG